MNRPNRKIRTGANVQQAAKDLRKHMTGAEQKLWSSLRNRQLNGLKFRRQHPIGPCIVDFFCPAQGLIVEIDGPIHEQQQEQDAQRTDFLLGRGYRLIRFTNAEVLETPDQVLEKIWQACQTEPE